MNLLTQPMSRICTGGFGALKIFSWALLSLHRAKESSRGQVVPRNALRFAAYYGAKYE